MKACKPSSYVETIEGSSPRFRRLLRQERLILDVTETLCELLAREGMTRSELARRLGKTKGFVSQALAGNRNLTLRTLADMFDALGYNPSMTARPASAARRLRGGAPAARRPARAH